MWMDTIEILRKDTLASPLLVWNDMKRMELFKFIEDELERFYVALAINHDLSYDSADVELIYTPSSEGEGSVICGVHVELLPEYLPLPSTKFNALWQIEDPMSLFQAVFQAMVLGFTPFFGNNNLPETDLRLIAHVLTWIYEWHSEKLFSSITSLNVIEIVVGVLREVIEIVVPLVVLSLAKCCKNKSLFESDAWDTKSVQSQGAIETVQFVGYSGMTQAIRVPCGRAREVLEKIVQDGRLNAQEAIQWQDTRVPDKVQLGLALDFLSESILRISGGDTNMESFPPSATCCSLSREEVLCHLVQILLRAKTPVFGRILDMISHISKGNKDAMKRLFKYGMFEIVLWKLLASDIFDAEKVMIIKFLRQYHLSQEYYTQTEEHSPWDSSILRLYLPQGLILKLMSKDDSTFKTILDSDSECQIGKFQ